ncbi:MAG: TRAP transporter small permease [bacterium]|nr:TRAP transporter small permease [bacterium]
MQVLKKIDQILCKVELSVLVLLLSVMVLLAFAQVALRNIFSTGIFWADLVLRHLVLWLGFIGALLAASDDKHIHIDALRHFMPKKMRYYVDIVTHLFAVVVCYFFMRASWVFVRNDMAEKRTIIGDLPSWTGEIIIPIGFGLLAVHFLIKTIMYAGNQMNQEVQP